MHGTDTETTLRTLVDHAWDREVNWSQIKAWTENFVGATAQVDEERARGLAALSRFLYFGKRLVREMLRSLYRDQFESPLIQRIRRNFQNTNDSGLLRQLFLRELASTRFIGVGNPSESGAHLLYYFRQINHLSKELFVDFGSAFVEATPGRRSARLVATDSTVSRYVFFDDLVGTADQSSAYLSTRLRRVRKANQSLDLRFMSLFATTEGIAKLNEKSLFDGKATCLFELDESYRAFDSLQRYFPSTMKPAFDLAAFEVMASHYGGLLMPGHPRGYRDGQLLIGFTHNTPDNTLPIFWSEGRYRPWSPIFIRYDKVY